MQARLPVEFFAQLDHLLRKNRSTGVESGQLSTKRDTNSDLPFNAPIMSQLDGVAIEPHNPQSMSCLVG